MNRKAEYYNLLTELDNTPIELEYTLKRAKSKIRHQHKRNFFIIPISSLLSLLIVFTILVNSSITFASACQRIPLIKELTQLVAFSPSLTDAIENGYIQQIEMEQNKNNITSRIEYVIVDQKQLKIFYSLDSDTYSSMEAIPEIRNVIGNKLENYSLSSSSFDTQNGKLQHMTVDFADENMPNGMQLILKVRNNDNVDNNISNDKPINSNSEYIDENYISTFTFQLKFNPYYTSQGETISLNQTFKIDNQTLIITTIEIYPTHIRLNFNDVEDNTAWLKSLEFYLENENGKRYESISNGITASGCADSPMMKSHRLESSFFSKSKKLILHITGVTWLDKDMQKVKVNLKNETIETLPQNVALEDIERKKNDYTLTFSAKKVKENASYQIWSWNYYDENDKKYSINGFSSCGNKYLDKETGKYIETPNRFNEKFTLTNYPYEIVYLSPVFSRKVNLSFPIEIQVK